MPLQSPTRSFSSVPPATLPTANFSGMQGLVRDEGLNIPIIGVAKQDGRSIN